MSKELEEYKYSNLELLREIWFNVPEGSQKIHQKHFDLILSKLNELQAIKEAKPSEALEDLEMLHDCSTAIQELPSSNWVEYAENVAELDLKLYLGYENIKQALLRLDHLDDVMNLLPNRFSAINNREIFIMRREMFEKYQEQEKVLEIIKKKRVNVANLIDWFNYSRNTSYEGYLSDYYQEGWFIHFKDNDDVDIMYLLTEEEFDLLKRYCDEQDN